MVRLSPWRSRSRSLGLPCSLLGLGRHRLAFEVFRGLRARRHSEEHRRVGLRGLRSRSELLYRPGQSESDLPLLGFVSVGSALSSFAHRRVPLHRHGFRSPLPRGLAAPLRQRGCHPLRMFRPRGFSPPRRLPPPVVRGFVAPRCRSWGSSRFWSGRLGSAGPKALPDSLVPFPATSVSYPSKDDPRLQPVPRHRGLCLPGVRPAALATRFTSEALLRSRVWDFFAPLPALGEVPSFLGLVPLQGPSRPSRTRADDPRCSL